jgi:hypothetical protein
VALPEEKAALSRDIDQGKTVPPGLANRPAGSTGTRPDGVMTVKTADRVREATDGSAGGRQTA